MTSSSPLVATARGRRRDIQGLRAVAVVAVVLCHAIGWPAGGFAGVDVFFVVSGFLIGGMLLHDVAEHGRIRFGHFYAARVRRILPTAVVALVVVVAAGFVVLTAMRAWQTFWDAVWAAVFAVNWHLAAAGTDYFATGDAVSPLQHFWTLSVEEQFYLVWPAATALLLLALPLRARRAAAGRTLVGVVAVAVCAASLGWGFVQTGADPTAAYFSTATRAWELAAGVALAALVPLLERMPRPLGMLLGWAGLAGVIASFFVVDPDGAIPVPGVVLPVAATVLVLAGGVGGDPRHRHLFALTNPASVFVGDMSYSLYLWHFPVIVFAAVLLPATSDATAIVLGIIAVVSVVSYLALEQPLYRSPLLRQRSELRAAPDHDALAPPEPAATPEPVPTAPRPAALASTRPAGWQPGQRYFPGAARPLAPAAEPAAAAHLPAALTLPEPAASAMPEAAPSARSQPRDGEPDQQPSAPSRGAAWASWRARFAGQIGGALLGLGIAAGALVLVLQLLTGTSVLPSFDLPSAAQAGDQEGDPIAEIQAELAAAATATAWPDLSPSMDSVIATGSGDNPAAACFSPTVEPDISACTWGDASAPVHLYLVGDSTAMAYAPAFKAIAQSSGGQVRITTVGLYGCRFTDVLVANDGAGVMAACPGRKDMVADAIRTDQPAAVIVTDAYTLGRTTDGRDLSATDLAAAVQAETASYDLPGRIVYLAPPPESVSPSVCYSPSASPASCLGSVDASWQQLDAATTAAASASGDRTIDSLPFSCWQSLCPAFAGSTPVRYDQTHITTAYAQKIAPALGAELRAAGLW